MLIPDDLLKNKNILLGVTGSIAVYKSLELVRLLTKVGANVRVVMSSSAKKFVTPLSFETLTSHKILDDTNESWVNDHNHIKITDWADVFVIAPVTANTLAKLANGIADNILLQCALAYSGEKLLAPSANTHMILNPLTQTNITRLKSANYTFINTQVKELACKTTGDGAMAEPMDIFWKIAKSLLQNGFWKERTVLLTGGGTREKIDDVRYLSNFSSGKMASSLATALYCRGANVTLIATKYESNLPKEIQVKNVSSSMQMMDSLKNSIAGIQTDKKPFLFMVAAVSDYIPKNSKSGKLKKEHLGKTFDLSLREGADILDSVDKTQLTTIGFKAEMDKKNALKNATKMLDSKNIDAVCLNILEDSSSFATDTNTVEFITKEKVDSIPQTDKLSVSFTILEHSESLS